MKFLSVLFLLGSVYVGFSESQNYLEIKKALDHADIQYRSITEDDHGLITLDLSGSSIKDISILKDAPLVSLGLKETSVTDLSPLRNSSLVNLDLGCSQVTDLSALENVPLKYLNIELTPVSDLSPLRRMPIEALVARESNVKDIAPLAELPLKILDIYGTYVTDLSPLKHMELEALRFSPERILSGIDSVRTMTTLKKIGRLYDYLPAQEFWDRYDKGEFHSTTEMPSLDPESLKFIDDLEEAARDGDENHKLTNPK